MHRFLACLSLLAAATAVAQPNVPAADRFRLATQREIIALHQKMDQLRTSTSPREKELQAACSTNCTEVSAQLEAINTRKLAAMAGVASQIEHLVDVYISQTVSPEITDADCKRLAPELTQILGNDAVVNPPRVFAVALSSSRALVVFYAVSGGTAVNSYTVVRAFKSNGRMLVPSAVTGSDMNNYGDLSVLRLNAPLPDELWLLIWGRVLGANGPNNGMRVYAYGARGFRTMWMSANIWANVEVTPTSEGFRMDGTYYRQEPELHQSYQVTLDGLYMTPVPAPSDRVK